MAEANNAATSPSRRGAIFRAIGHILGAACLFALGFLLTAAPLFYASKMKRDAEIQRNESSAVTNLRALVGAETSYNSAKNVYTGSLADLLAPVSDPWLDGDWTQPKEGYVYELSDAGGDGQCFEAVATPHVPGRTGTRVFNTDCSGVIYH